jgi:hypothetical protein
MKHAQPILACIAVLAVLVVPCVATDGIPANVPFAPPYQVDGQRLPEEQILAVITIDASGVATLRVTCFTGKAMREKFYTVTPKDGPAPGPGPNPPPTPTNLTEQADAIAYTAAMKLAEAGRADDAAKLSAIYTKLATEIGGKLTTADQIVKATRLAKEMALAPERVAIWESWSTEAGKWVNDQVTAGKIKTMDDYKAVWVGIGQGLARVK